MPSPKHSASSNAAVVTSDIDQPDNKVVEAAFYSVTNNLTEKLKDKEDLVAALCIAGRNPTLSQVDSLWTGSAIDLKEFCQIVPKIDAVSEGKLSVAFSKLSPKKQNSMPKDQLTSILTSCGEALSTNDVKIFLECVTQTNPEVIDKSGEVSYQKLISVLVTAAKDAKNNSVNKFDLQNKPSPLKRMAGGSRRRRSSIALQKMPEAPSNIQHWIKTSVKGSFFFDDDKKDIISHQYQMEVPEDSSVYITVKSRLGDFEKQLPEHGEIDTRIFILSEEDNSFKLYSFTHEKNDKDEYVCRTELKRGTYSIIPFTTGCFFTPKHESKTQPETIIKIIENKPLLQSNYIDALTKIFNIMDLDENNLLSRQEFNLFNWRTSGEEVADDEWEVVKDNFELEDGELTLNGFIDLHQMEAEDCNGNVDDLWVTLYTMGFNESLHLDESCPFEINMYTPTTKINFEISGLKSGGHILTKAVTKFVVDNGNATKIKNLQDLSIYQLLLSNWSCIIVQNKSHSVISVKIDCSESENCRSHQDNLDHSVTVGPKTTVIAHHLMPIISSKPWKVKYTDTLIR